MSGHICQGVPDLNSGLESNMEAEDTNVFLSLVFPCMNCTAQLG